jgi:hypothetical protein
MAKCAVEAGFEGESFLRKHGLCEREQILLLTRRAVRPDGLIAVQAVVEVRGSGLRFLDLWFDGPNYGMIGQALVGLVHAFNYTAAEGALPSQRWVFRRASDAVALLAVYLVIRLWL